MDLEEDLEDDDEDDEIEDLDRVLPAEVTTDEAFDRGARRARRALNPGHQATIRGSQPSSQAPQSGAVNPRRCVSPRS